MTAPDVSKVPLEPILQEANRLLLAEGLPICKTLRPDQSSPGPLMRGSGNGCHYILRVVPHLSDEH